ncbi:flippase [Fibrella rubiginis]|nr:flippase [Fibrella rubiginis]
MPEGQWRKLSVNIASLVSVQVANYLLPLLTVPYVSRLIGPERLGLLNISLGYNHYFVLLISFGFDLSVVRLVAIHRQDTVYISRLFSEVITAKFILFFVSIGLFAGLAVWLPAFREHLWLNMVTCLYCLGTVLFPQWLYQGMEDLSRMALFNLIGKTIFTVGVLFLIRTADDYAYQNLAMSSGHVIVGLISLTMAMHRYQLVYRLPNWGALYKRYKEGITLFFSTVVVTLYSSSHILLLSFVSTAYAAGVFSAASKLEALIRTFISLALNQALFPVIAKAFGEDTERGLTMVRRIGPILLVGTVLISLCILVTAPLLIKIMYGNKFTDSVVVLRIISILPILLSLNSLMGMHTLLNLRMDRAYFSLTAGVSVVGCGLAYLATSRYGAIGASSAWVATELLAVMAFYAYLKSRGVCVIRMIEFRRLFTRPLAVYLSDKTVR